jgi:hypothetical protein
MAVIMNSCSIIIPMAGFVFQPKHADNSDDIWFCNTGLTLPTSLEYCGLNMSTGLQYEAASNQGNEAGNSLLL